jgi:hypothetical protein
MWPGLDRKEGRRRRGTQVGNKQPSKEEEEEEEEAASVGQWRVNPIPPAVGLVPPWPWIASSLYSTPSFPPSGSPIPMYIPTLFYMETFFCCLFHCVLFVLHVCGCYFELLKKKNRKKY